MSRVIALMCCLLLVCCLFLDKAVESGRAQGSPRQTHSVVDRLDTRTAQHQAFKIRAREYDFYRVRITNPQDSRYGLEVVWVSIPSSTYEFSVVDVRKDADISSAFGATAKQNTDIVLMNGGYFGQADRTHFVPLGLVVADGTRINKLRAWSSGGVIYATTPKSAVRIERISEFAQSEPFEALQSKPLLIEDSEMGIRSDDHQLANRTAVALCSDGSLVLVGAFAEGGAVSLYEFATLLKSGKLSRSPVSYALNMDGGPGSHMYVPSLNLHFGSDTSIYVPNLIRLSAAR